MSLLDAIACSNEEEEEELYLTIRRTSAGRLGVLPSTTLIMRCMIGIVIP
jgi:hypothetical protein